MNSLTKPSKSYLLKEVVAGEVSLREASAGEAFITRKGAIYTLLDTADLDPIDLVLAVRQGNTLVVTLPDGSIIKLEGFFPEGAVDINEAFARFSENTTVDFRDDDDPEKDGSINWTLWGLGGAAALGGAYLLSSSQDADGSDISVSVDGANSDDGSAPAGFSIQGVSSRRIGEGTDFSSETPTTANGDGEIEWSLEGEDAGLFIVNPSTGVVSPAITFDFEAPVDANKDNRYRYLLVATDAAGNQARKFVDVYIDDVTESETLRLDSISSSVVPENSIFEWELPQLSEAIGSLTWMVTGDDAAYFSVDSAEKIIRFESKDFEAPRDFDRNNKYTARLTVVDEDGNSASKLLEVIITNEIEAAELLIDGLSNGVVLEDLPFTFAAPIVKNASGSAQWSVVGEDSSFFSVNAVSGAISFSPKDFENPEDADGDNIYNALLVVRDDDGNTGSQPFAISVVNRGEGISTPVGKDQSDPSSEEGNGGIRILGLSETQILELDSTEIRPWVEQATGTIEWSITGPDAGENKGIFSIDPTTGIISFNGQDFERPLDVGGDNAYDIIVRAEDSEGAVATKSLRLSVIDDKYEVVTDAPVGSNEPYPSTLAIRETSAVGSPLVIPQPSIGDTDGSIFWRLAGTDAAHFEIDTTSGVIAARTGLDFEAPVDADLDNYYELQLIGVKERILSLSNLTEGLDLAPEEIVNISSIRLTSVDLAGELYLNNGSSKQLLTPGSLIDVTDVLAGRLSYVPLAGKASSFTLKLLNDESDAIGIKQLNFSKEAGYRHSFKLQVTDVNEGIQEEADTGISILGLENAIVEENRLFITQPLSLNGYNGEVEWLIDGEDYGHQDLVEDEPFQIDGFGRLLFNAPNYEQPLDTQRDNSYRIKIMAVNPVDGSLVASKSITYYVTDDPTETQSISLLTNTSIEENQFFQSIAPQLNGGVGEITWSLKGDQNDDSALFNIDPVSGVVTMTAKDYEVPLDVDQDNVYRLTVVAEDEAGHVVEKAVSVAVQNLVENEQGSGSNNGTDSEPNDTPPVLVKIFSPGGDKTYSYGETVLITAAFNKPVQFLSNSIAPSILLSNGKEASYYGGNGTYQISFAYTVEESDLIDQIDVTQLIVGSLQSSAGIDFSEMIISSIGSNLADNDYISLDATPRIVGVDTLSLDGTYGLGAKINLVLNTDQIIYVGETDGYPPVLALNNGGEGVYKYGSGTNQLVFEYTVGLDEETGKLNVLAFAENDFLFNNIAGLALSDSLSSLPGGGLSDNTNLIIGEPDVPSIIDIAALESDGTYILGDTVTIDVAFNGPVWVKSGDVEFGSLDEASQNLLRPYLALTSGGIASYESGSGTSTLRFIYQLQDGEIADDLDVTSLAENGADLVSELGSPVRTAITLGSLSDERNITVDAEPPSLISIVNAETSREVVTAIGSERIKVSGIITLKFDDKIDVSGSDAKLILSGIDDAANPQFPAIGSYVGHSSDAQTIDFSYSGFLVDEYIPIDATALIENGMQILDFAGNAAQTRISLGINDIAGTLLAGAGEFVADQLGLRLFDAKGELLVETVFDPTAGDTRIMQLLPAAYSGLVMIELFDVNAESPDYVDEFTGQLKSLSDPQNGSLTTLRLVVDADSVAEDKVGAITLTPFGELAVKLVEYVRAENGQEVFPLSNDYLVANNLVSDLFQLSSITSGGIKFTTQSDFSALDGIDSDEQFGLALAALSTLDSQSGSIGNTLDNILAAWITEVEYAQAGLPSPGALSSYLSQVNNTLGQLDGANSVPQAQAISNYLRDILGGIESTDSNVDSSSDSEAERNRLQNISGNDTSADQDATAGAVTEIRETSAGPSPIEGAALSSPAEAALLADRSELLMSSSVLLSAEIESLMSELVLSTNPSSEQLLSQELATYTAAARIRDALLSEDSLSAMGLVADYRQLGFAGIDETTIGLANKVLKAALLSEDSSDLVGLVSSALMDFASLQSLIMPSGSGTDYEVTIGQDLATQLSMVASKLEVGLGDSDYDDVLVDFLREQLLDDSGKQVLATFESSEGMLILHSIVLPSALLAGMSSVNTLSVEGLDASGSWVDLRSFTAEDIVGGAVSLTPSYQGFSSFRLTTSTPMNAELRESLVGESVTFSAQAELALPASLDVAGLSQFSALPGSMAVQLARWTGVETWDEYQALDSLSPMVSALHASYVDFYGEEPVSGELQALLRLSLLLSETEASPFFAEMRSHCGSFCETDLELLTNVALDSVSLSSILPELQAAYQAGEGVTDVMRQLHGMAWLEDSQQLLQEPVDTLIERLMIISNETPLDTQAERQVARLSSIVKFKQLLSGDADIEALALTAEDYQHFGFADVTEDQSSLLTRQLSASSAVTPATLKSFVEEFQSSYAAASEAFDALLAGGNYFEQRVVLQAEDDLSSILSLLSANFGEDSPAFNNLVSAITGYMSSTDRVLATLDISGAGIDYVDVSNVQGHAVMGDIPLYATLYEAASGEGTRVELIRDPAVAGRFWLPESVSMAGYSTLELGVTGYSGAIEQLAEATVVGSTRGLSAEHLSFFGYEDYDGRDAVALEQMAEAALRSNADLTLEGLLGTYDAARAMIQWQDESDFTHQQWDAMWQWGTNISSTDFQGLGQTPFEGVQWPSGNMFGGMWRGFDAALADRLKEYMNIDEMVLVNKDASDETLFEGRQVLDANLPRAYADYREAHFLTADGHDVWSRFGPEAPTRTDETDFH